MNIIAAGAGRLSTIAIASSLLSVTKTKNTNAMGLFPRDDPNGSKPQCLARGTHIRTADGEVPVESLAIGALVMTTSGALPVKWVGRQAMKRNASASWHPSVVPVRVSRFAIDDRTPHRDLYLSQEHCLFIDGVLIPVKYLVNGRSIAFDDDAKMSETIEYFGIQLDTHEVVFAEGMAAETFQHWGDQPAWHNLSDYHDLYGTEPGVMSAFAPTRCYTGGRAEVRGLLRLAASRFVDVRDPIQIAYDRIAARAMATAA
jgi:hypothetical protein